MAEKQTTPRRKNKMAEKQTTKPKRKKTKWREKGEKIGKIKEKMACNLKKQAKSSQKNWQKGEKLARQNAEKSLKN